MYLESLLCTFSLELIILAKKNLNYLLLNLMKRNLVNNVVENLIFTHIIKKI